MTNNKKSPAQTQNEQTSKQFIKQLEAAKKLYQENVVELNKLKADAEYKELLMGYIDLQDPNGVIDTATDLLFEFTSTTELPPESEMYQSIVEMLRNFILLIRNIRFWHFQQAHHRGIINVLHPILHNGQKLEKNKILSEL